MNNSSKGTANRKVLTKGEAKLKEFTIFYSKDNFICILEHSKTALCN